MIRTATPSFSDTQLGAEYKKGFIEAATAALFPGGDPPLGTTLSSAAFPFTVPIRQASADLNVPVTTAAGPATGTVAVDALSVSGPLAASWADADTSGFAVSTLAASGATVTGAGGSAVGSGAVALAVAGPISAAISGNAQYNVNGTGTLAFYGSPGSGLGVGGDWDAYTAVVSGTVSITITTDALSLNGQVLPAGTYTIATTSATLTGSGPSTSPNFAGAASITATGATVDVGKGTGTLAVAGTPLDPANRVTLTGYSGTVDVSPGSNGGNSVTLNGDAGQVLQLSPSPATFTINQNQTATFPANVQASFADTYTLTAIAPPGWGVTIDASGNVTVIPAPGLQGGTFPVQIIARSKTDSNLVTQSTVEVTITPTQPAIALSVAPDPQFTVPLGGAFVPTGFRATIQNLGPAADTFNLSFSNVPSGFTLLSSASSVVIPAGQTAIIGVYLKPQGQVPAAGTQVSFTVTATGVADPTLTQSATQDFTIPAIDAVSATSNPVAVSTTPGVAATTTVTFSNAGNEPESITLASSSSTGLTVAGLAPLSLAPGDSMTERFITFTQQTLRRPLETARLAVTITATYGPAATPQTQTITIPVNVVVPGAAAIASASTAASQLGNSALALRLSDLSTALTNLVQTPSSIVYQGQAQASLTAVNGLLGADPYLEPLVPTLAGDAATLAQASTAAAVQTVVTTLGNDLGTLGTTLTDQVAHGFTLSFVSGGSQVVLPQVPTSFQIALQNTGSQTTTYDLSLSGLPSGVTGSLSQPSITLAPGQGTPGLGGVANLTVTLTSTSTTELPPFGFTVTAAAEGASEIAQSITGALTPRTALVQVTSVTPAPAFTDPGGQVDVSARILNAVNMQQQAMVSYTVTDSGNHVLFTSQPVSTTLNVLTTLSTVDLGNLDTTGFALGDDTITVTVSDASGTPIPGATATGTLLIGSPVTASLSVGPESVTPGTSTVTNTLTINSQQTIPSALDLLGQASVAGASSVVQNGDFLYVTGSAGISVFNIAGANLSAPQLVRVVGSPTNLLAMHGSLLVSATGGGGVTRLDTFSLADPSNPQFLGTTGEIPYSAATQIIVTDTDVFVVFVNLIFDASSHAILAQTGGMFAVNIVNPAAPFFDGDAVSQKGTPAGRDGVNDGILFNDNGTDNDGIGVFPPVDTSGGNQNEWDAVQVAPTILLLTGSTSTGSQSQTGMGVVHVVDISDPRNMRVLRDIVIPGTVQALGIALDGNVAVVTASQGGFQNGSLQLSGDVVLATLDLTDPANPQLIHTEQQSDASIGLGFRAFDFAVGDNLFVFDTGGLADNTPTLYLLDASDPDHPVFAGTPAPSPLNGIAGSDNLIFTTDSNSLIIYQIAAAPGIPVTAQVEVPNNNGVSVVPGSFSVAPTQTIPGTGFDTLVFNLGLSAGAPSQTITWQSTVSSVEPGQARTVVQGGTVDFVSAGTPGTLTLPAQSVIGEQIIGLAPATQTVAPGTPAAYMVELSNPTTSAVTYTLAVQGVPARWVSLAPTFLVNAGAMVSVPLTLTSDPFAAAGTDGFAVIASGDNGATSSVQGSLVLQGTPAPPDADSHGAVLTLSPAQASAGQGTSARYVIELINTGSSEDTFALAISGLPAGVTASFSPASVDVPPGAGNFRDVTLTLTASTGTAAGALPFNVTATSTTHATTSATVSGTLNVLAAGVAVSLNAASGAPGTSFQLTVTNTGAATDTFDLSLGGPAAVVASLGTPSVTLAPGATQLVTINTGAVNFAIQGALGLTATATSRTNSAIAASTSAALMIPATSGITAEFQNGVVVVPIPGTSSFQLLVNNTGNTQDSYIATISGTSGPVTASLVGLDGLPTQSIPIFILPGLATGAVVLNTDLFAAGTGMVTVKVQSLSNASMTASATAMVGTPAPTPTFSALAAPSDNHVWHPHDHPFRPDRCPTGSLIHSRQRFDHSQWCHHFQRQSTPRPATSRRSSIRRRLGCRLLSPTPSRTASRAIRGFATASSSTMLAVNKATPTFSCTGCARRSPQAPPRRRSQARSLPRGQSFPQGACRSPSTVSLQQPRSTPQPATSPPYSTRRRWVTPAHPTPSRTASRAMPTSTRSAIPARR